MTDRLLVLEIISSACVLFSLVWIIKFSILLSGVKSFSSHSLFSSLIQNIGRGLVELLETISLKKKHISENFFGLEVLTVILGVGSGLIAILASELSVATTTTFNIACVSLIYISLGTIELKTRSWKNIDLVFLFYLKNYLILLAINVASMTFVTQSNLLHGLDYLIVILSCIYFFKEAHYFCGSDKEASLIEISYVTTLIVITTNFLMRKTILDLQNYYIELVIFLLLGVLSFTLALASGQLERLKSLDKRTNIWLLGISVYILIRLVVWLI